MADSRKQILIHSNKLSSQYYRVIYTFVFIVSHLKGPQLLKKCVFMSLKREYINSTKENQKALLSVDHSAECFLCVASISGYVATARSQRSVCCFHSCHRPLPAPHRWNLPLLLKVGPADQEHAPHRFTDKVTNHGMAKVLIFGNSC